MRYDRIMDAVKAGEADFGVVIHEGRFVYRERGLECLQDLGEWWQARTGLPVPLGCIAVRAGMGEAAAEEFGELLRESILMARSDVEATIPLVTRHAQELEPDVLRRHISTYVNDYSLDLSKEGLRAMREMEKMARGAGILR
jgi:1,4-dihydroxy-6-naphthoate synthase